MITEKNVGLYTKTINRLNRAGYKDPTSQIIGLAEEIERYREKIYGLEEHIKELTKAPAPTQRPQPWEQYEKAYIELRPTCSKCGAALEKVAANQVCKNTPDYDYYTVEITPNECPNCHARFGYIVFQGELPAEVDV